MDWSSKEVKLIVEDYFSMLFSERLNQKYNKAEHKRALFPALNGRSFSSIEYKHRNISAILEMQNITAIKGYKSLYNFQQKLFDEVRRYLQTDKARKILQLDYLLGGLPINLEGVNFAKVRTEPPKTRAAGSKRGGNHKQGKINHLEREQKNGALGLSGEEFVVGYEKWRLRKERNSSLADKVERISAYDDGAGFDILSKNSNGTDRYIEVKTTNHRKQTPFFFSKKEYEFSLRNSKNYFLYRVFDFSSSPKLFMMNGNFDDFCNKEIVSYRGHF